jgi:hypothetical protein
MVSTNHEIDPRTVAGLLGQLAGVLCGTRSSASAIQHGAG